MRLLDRLTPSRRHLECPSHGQVPQSQLGVHVATGNPTRQVQVQPAEVFNLNFKFRVKLNNQLELPVFPVSSTPPARSDPNQSQPKSQSDFVPM